MEPRALLEGLVRIASVTGNEAEAVGFLRAQAQRDGLRTLDDEAGNLVVEAGRGERLLLFVGHVDTVPGHIPVRVEDGELWGRGSVDAKGTLAAAYCAARVFRDHPGLRVRVVGAVDEEGRSRGVLALPRDWDPEWILVGEPSGAAAVTLAYKGILRGALRATRAVTHGASGHESAADVLAACWMDVRARLAPRPVFPAVQARLDGLATVSDGLHESASARFQLRLPPARDPVALGRLVASVARRYDVAFEVEEAIPAVVTDRRTPLVAALLTGIRSQGLSPRLVRKTGTSDMNHLALMYPGRAMAAYGPGDSRLDHTPMERLALAEYDAAVAVLAEVMGSFARRAPGTRSAALPLPA